MNTHVLRADLTPWTIFWPIATHVMIRKVDYDLIWKILLAENVTHMNGAPTIMIQVVHHPDAVKLPKPITCTVAGSAPTATLIARMKELNMDICHVYGLTETYGPITKSYRQQDWGALSSEDLAQKFARQGHVYLVSDDVRVVDSEMKDVAWNGRDVGEIVFRGNLVMKVKADSIGAAGCDRTIHTPQYQEDMPANEDSLFGV